MLSHYVIVDSGLPVGLKCAMVVHAAGESSPGELPSGTRAVVLETSRFNLCRVAKRASDLGINSKLIVEDEELMAIGFVPLEDLTDIRKVTSNLPLIS